MNYTITMNDGEKLLVNEVEYINVKISDYQFFFTVTTDEVNHERDQMNVISEDKVESIINNEGRELYSKNKNINRFNPDGLLIGVYFLKFLIAKGEDFIIEYIDCSNPVDKLRRAKEICSVADEETVKKYAESMRKRFDYPKYYKDTTTEQRIQDIDDAFMISFDW